MKLIRELTESVNYLTEEKDGKKSLYIEGPFLVAEAVNKNKRMYKEETMRNEVARYAQEYIQKNLYLIITMKKQYYNEWDYICIKIKQIQNK